MGRKEEVEGRKEGKGRVKMEKGVQLTWEGICKTILKLVSIVVCICELSHIHTELTQTLKR